LWIDIRNYCTSLVIDMPKTWKNTRDGHSRIYHSAGHGWVWERVEQDGTIITAPRTFETYEECFSDSRRNRRTAALRLLRTAQPPVNGIQLSAYPECTLALGESK
jgi:hypothetical protein